MGWYRVFTPEASLVVGTNPHSDGTAGSKAWRQVAQAFFHHIIGRPTSNISIPINSPTAPVTKMNGYPVTAHSPTLTQ